MEPYIEAIQQGRLPALRALRISGEEEMIRQFVLQLKLGRLSAEPFRQRFGIDVICPHLAMTSSPKLDPWEVRESFRAEGPERIVFDVSEALRC